jgi:hypothetical protein
MKVETRRSRRQWGIDNQGSQYPTVARDDVRAKIRSTIKRLLAKYGYPPDAEADAIKRVLDQMETFADDWSPEA